MNMGLHKLTQFVPIALFAYRRPEHLKKTLEGLKTNQVPLIYAFSDGARSADEEPLVASVRRILRAVDWCEIRLIERETNLGLGSSIRTGVGEILEKYDRLIVVEDDIVLRHGAYEYTIAALEHYQDEPQVMSISMWSHPSLVIDRSKNGFFSRRFVCWGWATYAYQWQKFNASPIELYNECERRGINVLKWGKDLKWQAEKAEKRNLWYVGFALTHFLHNGLSYFPTETLTVNIGFDGSGENCKAQSGEASDLSECVVNLWNYWPGVCVASKLYQRFVAYFSPDPPKIHQWLIYIRRYLRMPVVLIRRISSFLNQQ
jgi:hypothetical protein